MPLEIYESHSRRLNVKLPKKILYFVIILAAAEANRRESRVNTLKHIVAVLKAVGQEVP